MAVLTNEARAAVNQEIEDFLSSKWEGCSIGRQDLRAAVDALDSFFDANAAAVNDALPAAAKAGLTVSQKALVLMYVIKRRYLDG